MERISDERLEYILENLAIAEYGEIETALRELQSLRGQWVSVNKLIAASKEAVCSLGECTKSLLICEAIFELEGKRPAAPSTEDKNG